MAALAARPQIVLTAVEQVMVNCKLRLSRMELGFVSCCHGVAALSILGANVATWFSVLLLAAVSASLGRYLCDRFQTFYFLEEGSLRARRATLFIAQEFARLGHRGEVLETEPPRLIYLSEFLLVLNLRAVAERGGGESVQLVLWPDSLERSDDRRLRRYLRFERQSSLHDI